MHRALERTTETYEKSQRYLAGASSTLSKRTSFPGDEPSLIARGKGCRVWDLDGNEYIDHRLALGPVSLGHAVDEINKAIEEQLRDGLIFGHPHPLEGEVAEKLCQRHNLGPPGLLGNGEVRFDHGRLLGIQITVH